MNNLKQNAQSTQNKIPQTPIAFVLYSVRPFIFPAVLTLVFVLCASLLTVSLPYVLKNIVDEALLGADDVVASGKVLFWVIMVPVVLAATYIFWRLSGFLGMQWLTKVEASAHESLYDYVTKHSHGYFSDHFAGAVSNKITNAASGTFRLLEQTLLGHFPNFVSFIASGILIFITNIAAGFIFVALIVLLVPMNVWLAKIRRPLVVEYSEDKSKFRGQAVDLLTNASAMRQYSRRPFELSGLQRHIATMRASDLRQWRMSEWILLINNVVIVVALGSMMYFMATYWQRGVVSTGDFVLVVSLVFSLSGTLTFIGSSINQFVRIYGEVEEGLREVLLPHEVVDEAGASELEVKQANIDWKNVTFQFDSNTVFSDFSLSIPTGQRVGLVGQSGAGKTTFVSLLLRQHDISAGEIMIDCQNIAHVTQDSLRQAIAIVPQEPALFHRSIRENIIYGKLDATEEEVIAVAKKAQAHEFITELPDGYNTMVGERGVKLSGGQKQRVAIARAMLKDAPILVLDEATSALDSESEVAIQKALETLMEGRTVIAIAHRLSTLREMDRIIVLKDGEIIEDGNHDSLATEGGVYERLWNHQAGGFLVD